MPALTIAELPFHERPVIELLHLEHPGEVDVEYAGYGWTRVDRLWLEDTALHEQPIENALVLALHSADDGEVLADDIELEFELTPGDSVFVLASTFLESWLPKLPREVSAIVLAMCNPFHATLRPVATTVPIHYAYGDVDSVLEVDDRGTRILLAAPTWCTLGP
jgi:hypothetical protein